MSLQNSFCSIVKLDYDKDCNIMEETDSVSVQHNEISQFSQEHQSPDKESCLADLVVKEFKEGFKNARKCKCMTWPILKTTIFTLILGIIPSFVDFVSDIVLGISYIMEDTPDYILGGTKCFTLVAFCVY